MSPIARAALAAALLAGGALPLVGSETARIRHVTSIYADDQGAGLALPEGVGCDASGRLVVGDTGNHRLLRFTYENRTLAGGAAITVSEVTAPSRVRLTSKGEIYVFDGAQRRIVRLAEDGGFRNVVSFEGVPAPATVVPKSFALDAADNLYVLDIFSARVLVLDAAGRFQRALALPADAGFVTDVAVDSAGTVLVLDATRRRILSAAEGSTAFTVLGGGPSVLTAMPVALAASKGSIFVVEGSGGSIATFGRDGTFLSRQLTAGWKDGSLNHPAQICISERDELFVADRDNSRVQVFGVTR
jgi:hypothetical protein